ncbi:VWA domain-containing protein [Candidatus Woesearchaeota archaeon]|nr:VWA domain-containing protein [Candidatus Woesearchaeota archaeon]
MAVKKAFLFTTDALIAAIIIVSGILIFSNLYIQEKDTEHINFLANDMLNIMSEIKVSEINNSYVEYLRSQGKIKNENHTLIELIGELWALNETGECRNLIKNITWELFPKNMGFSLAVANSEIYRRDYGTNSTLIAARKMISGYERSKPVKGSTSRAYLQSIKEKKTASYAYFGGFVGQGNISRQLELIPADAEILAAFLELDAGTSFDLYINNSFCSSFVPVKGNMVSTRWNISPCIGFFRKGVKNNISVIFTGLLNESFIAGGYVKVEYLTKEMVSNQTSGIAYYNFPGITGIINLYSSFYIPGNLNSMEVYIHFYNNKTTFLNIANESVFVSSGSGSDQFVNFIDNSTSMLSENIPIRMGVGNLSEDYNVTSGQPSDSVLVTDVSGSMNDLVPGTVDECSYDCCTGGGWCPGWRSKSCPYPGTCSNEECGACSGWTPNDQNYAVIPKTKLQLAKEAGLQFIDTVLNLTGNKVGLASYQSSLESDEPITDIKINLQNEINSYSTNWWWATCICCGINKAKDMLLSSPDEKFMVVMSDGIENKFCSNFNDYTGSDSGAVNSTDAGSEACSQGITVFAVGFGENADHETLKRVACNESLYYNASDAANISKIYEAIGKRILVIANYSSQIVEVSAQYRKSVLYPDSYIKFNYTPKVEPASFGEIEIVAETSKFRNCSPIITIPGKVRITEAKVLSYSGPYWTSFLSVNGNDIFNISDYGSRYEDIGDPFSLQIAPNMLQNGDNQLVLQTQDDKKNDTGCSKNNTLIYTAAVKSSITYSGVYPKAIGSKWSIETEDGDIITASVPQDYSGSKLSTYNSSGDLGGFDDEDSIDQAVLSLLQNLDFDNNGKININIEQQDLTIQALWVSQVPYLWGPAIAEVRIWQ